MAKGDVKRHTISKWARTQIVNSLGLRTNLIQVVYKTETGKNKKGKPKFTSQTKHERVS